MPCNRLFIVPFLLLHGLVMASQYPQRDGHFLNRHAEGWFFYEQPIPDPQPVEEPPPPPPPETTLAPIEPLPFEETPPPEPAVQAPVIPAFSAEWFRQNMQKYTDNLFDNPSEEALVSYLYLQKIMLDKSSKVTGYLDSAILNNPILDEEARSPNSAPVFHGRNLQVDVNRRAILSQLAKEDYGFWVFYTGTDPLARYLFDAIDNLERQYQFPVLAISLDGQPIPGHPSKQFRKDEGQSANFQIQDSFAVFLVSPEMKFAPVAQSLLNSDQLSDRIVLTAKNNQWITEEQYASTRNPLRDPAEFSSVQVDSAQSSGDPNNPSNYIEPNELLRLIKTSYPGL